MPSEGTGVRKSLTAKGTPNIKEARDHKSEPPQLNSAQQGVRGVNPGLLMAGNGDGYKRQSTIMLPNAVGAADANSGKRSEHVGRLGKTRPKLLEETHEPAAWEADGERDPREGHVAGEWPAGFQALSLRAKGQAARDRKRLMDRGRMAFIEESLGLTSEVAHFVGKQVSRRICCCWLTGIE